VPASLPVRVALSALTRPPVHRFGDDPSQVGELHLPSRRSPGPHPVAVVLHGGYWQTRFGKLVCRPLAADLAARGWAAWNLEYRRLGEGRGGGGGWPTTFEDVAAGIDHLAALGDPRLDLDRVVLVGHSAGGQLALWAAARGRLPAGAIGGAPRVLPRAVVALAPVTALRRAGVHARSLLGGPPEQVPDRWAQADPLAAAPAPVPVLLVHPEQDTTVPPARSAEYAEAARARGRRRDARAAAGEGHRDVIDPAAPRGPPRADGSRARRGRTAPDPREASWRAGTTSTASRAPSRRSSRRPATGRPAWKVADRAFVYDRPLSGVETRQLGAAAPSGELLGRLRRRRGREAGAGRRRPRRLPHHPALRRLRRRARPARRDRARPARRGRHRRLDRPRARAGAQGPPRGRRAGPGRVGGWRPGGR
jgi:acetyl esterase/lipase